MKFNHRNIYILLVILICLFSISIFTYAEPIAETKYLDDFDTIYRQWQPSWDGTYSYKIVSERAYNGEQSMKVGYRKNPNVQWPFLALPLKRDGKDNNLTNYNILSFWVYTETPPLAIKVKLEDYVFGSWESDITIDKADQWVEFTYDFTYAPQKVKLNDLKWIVFFAEPYQKSGSASFYIDDLALGATESFLAKRERERLFNAIDYSKLKDKSESEYVKTGIEFYNDGDIDSAWVEFKKALTINPYSSKAAYYFGMICEKKNDAEGAFMVYAKALSKDPWGYYVPLFDEYTLRIDKRAKTILKDVNIKKKLIDTFIWDAPIGLSSLEEANPLFKKGWILHRYLGLYEESINTYHKAIQLDPKFADAYKEIGLVFMKKQDYKTAKSYLEKALEIQPDHSYARHDLAICNKVLGVTDIDERIKTYKKALEADPDNVFPLSGLATTYMEMERYEEAIPLLKKAVTTHPEHFFSYVSLLEAYLKTGQYDKVIELYQRAPEKFSMDTNVLEKLAKAYKHKGMYESAIERYKIILDKNPNDSSIIIDLAGIYLAKGDIGEAVMLLEEKLPSYYPKEIRATYGIGKIYMNEGKYKEAISEFKEVLKIKPDLLDVIRHLQVIYATYLNDPEMANYYKKEFGRVTAKKQERKRKLFEDMGGISGIVTKSDGKTPIAGIKIWAFGNKFGGTALTDLEGKYIIEYVHQGVYEVSANKFGDDEDFENSEVEGAVVEKGAITPNIDFKLKKLVSISGRVMARDNAPLANVKITAHQFGIEDLHSFGNSVSDSNGSFRIEKLLPGTYRVTARTEGWQIRHLRHVAVEEDTEVKNINIVFPSHSITEKIRKAFMELLQKVLYGQVER